MEKFLVFFFIRGDPMAFFIRKKKEGSTNAFQVLSNSNNFFTPFGTNISKSDVVKICIDRVASQCAKLKPRYIKTETDKTVTEKQGRLSFLLKHRPNPLMTPYDFVYKVITLLLLNDNAFVYPMFDGENGGVKALYPLRPVLVEAFVDNADAFFLKFHFDDGREFTLPYENVIHLRKYFASHDLYGGNGVFGDHEAVLKTIAINENLK